MELAAVFATFGLNPDKASFAEANQALELFKSTVGRVVDGIKSALTAGFNTVSQVAMAASSAATLADQFGMTTTALKEMEVSATLGDVPLEQLHTSFSRLAVSATEAAQGNKEAMESLEGINLKDSNGQVRQVSELMLDLADKVANTAGATEQLALAQKVLGRGSSVLVPWLKGGRKGMLEGMAMAKKYGVAVSESFTEASKAFDLSTKKMALAKEGARKIFSSEDNIRTYTAIYESFASIASNPVVRYAIDKLGVAFGKLMKAIKAPLEALDKWLESPENQAKAIQVIDAAVTAFAIIALPALAKALWKVAAAAWSSGLAPTILAIVAALAALVLIVDDVTIGLAGGDSYFGDLLAWLNTSTPDDVGLMGTLKTVLNYVKDLIVWVAALDLGKIVAWINSPADEGGLIGGLHKIIQLIAQLTLDDFKAALQWVAKWTGFNIMLDVLKEIVNTIDLMLTWLGKLTGIHFDDVKKKVVAVATEAAMQVTGLSRLAAYGDSIKSAEQATRVSNVIATPDWYSKGGGLGSVAPGAVSNSQGATSITVQVSNTNANPDDIATKLNEVLDARNAEMMRAMQGQQ